MPIPNERYIVTSSGHPQEGTVTDHERLVVVLLRRDVRAGTMSHTEADCADTERR
jgi:hypothetical protein